MAPSLLGNALNAPPGATCETNSLEEYLSSHPDWHKRIDAAYEQAQKSENNTQNRLENNE